MTARAIAGELFHLELGKLKLAAGLGYAVSFLLVWALTGPFGNMAYVAGICAVLVWLSDVPGPVLHRLAGMAAFVTASILFAVLTHLLGETFWPHLMLLFIAAFVATASMVFGSRAYLVGWTFIIWAIVAPMFEMTMDLGSITLGLASGAGVSMVVVAGTTLIRRRLKGPVSYDRGRTWRQTLAANPDWKFETFGYATVVALVVGITTFIGWSSIATDPSWVANAALMIIGPDPRQLGYKGVQRALGTVLGILVGFWLVQIIPGEFGLVVAVFVVSFLVVSTMDVNYILLAFFWTLYMSLDWSLKGQEHVSVASLERVEAELLGIAIAVAAVFLLSALKHRRRGAGQQRQSPRRGGEQ